MTLVNTKFYKYVMSSPEGLQHREYRKGLARYVTQLPESVKQDILSRRDEIVVSEFEWRRRNSIMLSQLGFTPSECEMLADKRMDSPGMRNVIKLRVEEILKRRRRRGR